MPTIANINGFRFFFYSNEHDPPHIHVEKSGGAAKFNLLPVEFVYNKGMKVKELKKAEQIIEEEQMFFLDEWAKFFGN